eukprot:403352513
MYICSDVSQIAREYVGVMYQGQLLTEKDDEYLANLIENNARLRLFVVNHSFYESQLEEASVVDKQHWIEFRHQNDLSHLNKASLIHKPSDATTASSLLLQSNYGSRYDDGYRRGGRGGHYRGRGYYGYEADRSGNYGRGGRGGYY